MNRDWTRTALWALVCLIAFAVSFAAGYRRGSSRPADVQRDTVTVLRIDTLVVDRPVPVYHRVVDTMRVRVPVRDTIELRDTVLVDLPVEQVVYRDTLYRAWVSGYRPRLDSIHVFAPVRTVTVTERVPVEVLCRWGLGFTAGYGATVDQGSVRLAPFVGVGISYNILTW